MNDLSQGELLTGWKGFWWWQPVTWIPPTQVPCPPPRWCPPAPCPDPWRLGWTVTVQCRDGAWAANTVPPTWCWQGCAVPTHAVVTELRNGVPCRCFCPPGRCEAKGDRQRWFRPWLAPPHARCC